MWSCVQKWKGGIGKRGKRGEEGRKFDSRILIGLSFKHLDSRIWFFKSIIKINLVYLIKVSFRLVLKKKTFNFGSKHCVLRNINFPHYLSTSLGLANAVEHRFGYDCV
jgi:hypothetical protein